MKEKKSCKILLPEMLGDNLRQENRSNIADECRVKMFSAALLHRQNEICFRKIEIISEMYILFLSLYKHVQRVS